MSLLLVFAVGAAAVAIQILKLGLVHVKLLEQIGNTKSIVQLTDTQNPASDEDAAKKDPRYVVVVVVAEEEDTLKKVGVAINEDRKKKS